LPSHYDGDSETVAALNSYVILTRAANSLESRIFSTKILRGLTVTQFSILETLVHLGPQFESELSQKLLRSTGNITYVLNNLEKREYILRVHEVPDHRLIRIHLTEKGKTEINSVFPKVAAAIEKEFSILSSTEQSTLNSLCKIIGKGIRGK
jgi:MarR family transcriptional regulator, 2-MHQ and catechol-resistance regulon repressor